MKYLFFNLLLLLSLIYLISSRNVNKIRFNEDLDDSGTAPLIHCTKPQSNYTDIGLCEVYAVVYASSTPGIEITNNINNRGFNASGEYFLGTTTVQFTARNKTTSMSSTCTTSVTVNDVQGPTIMCPADIFTSSDPGVCYADVNIGNVVASDNCGIQSITSSNNGGLDPSGMYNVGTTIVTVTAADYSGNIASCVFDVQVTDTETPTISCPSDVSYNVDSGKCTKTLSSPGTPIVYDNCPGVTLNNNSPSSGEYPIGTTTVTYVATDSSGNSASCINRITVIGNPPSIICPTSITLSTSQGTCSATTIIPAATCSSSCPVVYTTSVNSNTFPLGITKITDACTDSGGNISYCDFEVTVIDIENPTITCPSDITQNTDNGVCTAFVNIPDPRVTDNCGISSTSNSYNNGFSASGVYNVGKTTVTFQAVDLSGNTSTCAFTVNIVNKDPSVTC